MPNSRSHQAPEPRELFKLKDVSKFLRKAAGKKNDFTGVMINSGALRRLADIIDDEINRRTT